MSPVPKKSFFYALLFLSIFNLQGMKETNKLALTSSTENKNSNAWFSKKTAHSALKLGIKAVVDYAPTIYTYGKPLLMLGGYIIINRTQLLSPSFSIQELRQKSDSGFSEQFLDMAANTIAAVGLDQSSIRFCNIQEATLFSEKKRKELGAIDKTFLSVDPHGVCGYGDWFKALPLDEQQFGFTHELIHHKEKDTPLTIYGGIALPFVTQFGINIYQWLAQKGINYCAKKYNLKENKTFQNCILAHNTIINSGLFHSLITALAMYKFLNYTEVRADIGAALALKTAQGGINLCNRWLRENPRNSAWYKIHDYHPSDETRLSYLTALQETFEKEESLK